ncbi:MAG: type II CAAX prenyl endopeptidase Rce1 family protein, partial [Acidimicrobiia bacterium]
RLAAVAHPVAAWIATAVWFAGVHLRLAEFPGLFAFALVLGGCWHVTRRLGLPLVAHVAFNATGLAMLTLR